MFMGPLLVIILAVGIMWLRSSFAKFTTGTFINTLGATLTKAAEKNPYPWFKQFLNSVAVPNSQIFGFLVQYGELFSALAITVGAILSLVNPHPSRWVTLVLAFGLAGGAFLNLTFWLGFGYTSVSTDSLNLLMLVVQVIALVVTLKQL